MEDERDEREGNVSVESEGASIHELGSVGHDGEKDDSEKLLVKAGAVENGVDDVHENLWKSQPRQETYHQSMSQKVRKAKEMTRTNLQ